MFKKLEALQASLSLAQSLRPRIPGPTVKHMSDVCRSLELTQEILQDVLGILKTVRGFDPLSLLEELDAGTLESFPEESDGGS